MTNLENGGRGGIHFPSTKSETSPAGVANLEPHSATVLSGESGAVANPVDEIPTDRKAFDRWLAGQSWQAWPDDLVAKADRYSQTLNTKFQPAVRQSYALRKAGIADWSAFTTAYAEHKAREVV
jgi:hypothetical protein